MNTKPVGIPSKLIQRLEGLNVLKQDIDLRWKEDADKKRAGGEGSKR